MACWRRWRWPRRRLSAAAQAEDLLARVKAKGELNVGTEHQFAPFDFVLNGEHSGLNVDLFAEIGKDMGLKINWIDLPWPSVLPGLDAQKFDMVGGPATVTKARLERYGSRCRWVMPPWPS